MGELDRKPPSSAARSKGIKVACPAARTPPLVEHVEDADPSSDGLARGFDFARIAITPPPVQPKPAPGPPGEKHEIEGDDSVTPAWHRSFRTRIAEGGAPLPGAARSTLERRLDADLSAVRIHTGPESDKTARAMSADAFTLGPHVHFASGRFNPGSAQGRSLLVHEVTHTLQPGPGTSSNGLVLGSPDSPAEQVADRIAAGAVIAGALLGRAAGRDDGVIRRHVTHSSRGLIGGSEEFVTGQDATGRYNFTTRGGWLDRSHVYSHDVQAIEVMDRLAARQTTIRVTSASGSGGAYTTVYQIEYAMIPEPVTDGHLEQLTIGIMMDHDRRFETFQRYNLRDVLAQTPFSYEDLPSDRVGVEIGLRYRRRMRESGVTAATPVDRINQPGHEQQRLRQEVSREVLGELDSTSGRQGLRQYDAFLRQQGRRAGGVTGPIHDYLHVSPEHHSFAPFVDPTLSPVTNPVPWLTDALPDWVAGAFRFTHHEHDNVVFALSDIAEQARRGIGHAIGRAILAARARMNPANWDQSASAMGEEGRRALSRVAGVLWAAANAGSGASSADDVLARMGRRVGEVVAADELAALARHMTAAQSSSGATAIQESLLANLRVMELPEWLRERGFIRYSIDPERLVDFFLTGRPD